MDLFDYQYEEIKKINKPISIIEMYGGIGSQLKALKRIGAKIDKSILVEVDINATISYAAVHHELHKHLDIQVTRDEMVKYLEPFGWWSNEKPYDINKLKDEKLKQLYVAQKLTNNLGDVFKLKTLPKVDIITWSTPCQDFSLAGKRAGFDGAKGGLTFITLELFKTLKRENKLPTYLLFENVPAIKDATNIAGFKIMLQELEALGFKNHVLEMNAKRYGIPQNRNRVFVLSINQDIGDYQYNEPKPFKLEKRLKDMLEENVSEKYYLSNKAIEGMLNTTYESGKAENRIQNDVASTLRARDYKDPKCVVVGELDIKGQDSIKRVYDKNHLSPTLTNMQGGNRQPKIVDEVKLHGVLEGKNYNQNKNVYDVVGVAPTLISGIQRGGNEPKILVPEATKKGYAEAYEVDGIYLSQQTQKRGVVQRGMIQTLKTSGSDVGVVIKAGQIRPKDRNYKKNNTERFDRFETRTDDLANTILTVEQHNAIQENLRIRKLTPKECWRLMGFDDQDVDNAKRFMSNSALYKQAGNSIVVNVLESIFKTIVE